MKTVDVIEGLELLLMRYRRIADSQSVMASYTVDTCKGDYIAHGTCAIKIGAVEITSDPQILIARVLREQIIELKRKLDEAGISHG